MIHIIHFFFLIVPEPSEWNALHSSQPGTGRLNTVILDASALNESLASNKLNMNGNILRS